jgi:hypothetical protein
MNRHITRLFAAAALVAIPVLCQAEGLWIHIRVDSSDEDGERVRVNVPIELVQSLMPIVESHGFHDGRAHLDGRDISKEELRQMVVALRDASDGEYVTVESKDENVRIAKQGNLFLVDVEDRSGGRHHSDDDDDAEDSGGSYSNGSGSERVKIRLRTEVLDALLSGEDDDLNIEAAVAALRHQPEGDLVSVEGGDETVHIWIDEHNTTED